MMIKVGVADMMMIKVGVADMMIKVGVADMMMIKVGVAIIMLVVEVYMNQMKLKPIQRWVLPFTVKRNGKVVVKKQMGKKEMLP